MYTTFVTDLILLSSKNSASVDINWFIYPILMTAIKHDINRVSESLSLIASEAIVDQFMRGFAYMDVGKER